MNVKDFYEMFPEYVSGHHVTSHWQARRHYWALRFNDGSDLDGALVGVYYDIGYKPPRAQALTTALFATRREARKFIRERFNNEHGGLPVPVKVKVKFEA